MKRSSFYHTPLHSTPTVGGFPSEYRHPLWYGKTRMVSLPESEKISKIRLFVLTWSTNVTDGQTLHDSIDRACIASRGKNDVLDQNLWGSWLGEHPKKFGTPLFISATVETSDWEIGTQHEFRFTLPNTSLRTKLGRVWIRRVPLPSPLQWWCNCVFYVPSKTDRYPD